jgi:hypothetical protein
VLRRGAGANARVDRAGGLITGDNSEGYSRCDDLCDSGGSDTGRSHLEMCTIYCPNTDIYTQCYPCR